MRTLKHAQDSCAKGLPVEEGNPWSPDGNEGQRRSDGSPDAQNDGFKGTNLPRRKSEGHSDINRSGIFCLN